MGAYKKFDKDLYKTHNENAINAVLAHLDTVGAYGNVNDDKYGPDICLYTGFKHKAYIEVEVKNNWRAGTKFPFATVQLPERKAKFLKAGKPIEFWILRADLKAVIIIPDYAVDSSLLVEVPNRLIESGEMFFQIPIEQCVIKEL